MANITLSRSVHGAILSRRQFVKSGGVLVVGMAAAGDLLAAPRQTAAGAAVPANTPNPALWSSWLEIRADNTMAIHTGRVDFGQSTVTTAYRQIVADELDFPYDAITSVVMGDTDRTPDGGITAGLLALGGENLRKVAAYTRQAVLDLAAVQLGVERRQLTVKDGVISGGGRRLTYGQLVTGQELSLTIPVAGAVTDVRGVVVTGNPPTKPVSEYTVVGKSLTNFVTEDKVRAKERWVTDVRLPGMMHARVVHPKTLGSTLVSAGAVDRKRFPNAEVIVQRNLVGVVAPTEWEAIGAAQQVAAATKWTDWKGLPGRENLPTAMRALNWNHLPPTTGKSGGDVAKGLAGAVKTHTASYDVPYMKHAPIGPTVAVADVRPDGMVYLHVHNQHPSALRGMIATMLGAPLDKVVVRSYAGAGHYGRSNGGHSGAEDEAVLLSKAIGKPVRVQWMRPEDLQWSTCNPASYTDVQIGLDAEGTIVAAKFEHHRPAGDDDRLTGAVLAGLPTIDPPDERLRPTLSRFNSIVNDIDDPWLYDRVPNLAEHGYGTFQIGQKASPIAMGLRGHAMRTPGQLQENFAREVAMTEAASLAGIDPLEFRLTHTKEPRLIRVLTTLRQEAGWQNRPSPASSAAAGGGAVVSGQGVSAMLRAGTYWACACQVTVDRSTGKVKVDRYTIVVEPGIVINPLQLKRQIQGGAIMGISHALHEEMQFDESGITSRDWRSYPIATMADVPDVKVVILNHPEVGRAGGGSEAANALAVSAIAGAFLDATGKTPRRMPLRPDYVKGLLSA